MKRLLFAAISVVMMMTGVNASAQGKFGADSAECIKYLSYYQEYYKAKNYTDALPNWRKAYKYCPPTANQNMLVQGTTLLRQVVTKTKDAAERSAIVDTLLTLSDLRAQYYPNYATAALNAKGKDVFNYVKNDAKKSYDQFTAIVGTLKEKATPTFHLYRLSAAIDLYNQGAMDAEQIINLYQESIAALENTTEDKDNIPQVRTDVESLFIASKVASCDNLIALFTPRYEANPNDVNLVSNIVKMMSVTEGCTSNDLYLNAVTAMYKLDPSYNSAYFLYRLNSSRGNVADAIKYMEEAIAYPESDDKQDGEYYYELAAFCFKNGKNAQAFEAANKALALNETLAGKAYMLLGTIWQSASCGGNEVESRAKFWVAADNFSKARNADPSLAEECGRLIGQCSAYFPATADAFMYDITDGQSYTVSCGGMRATTTVRTQKK